MGSKRKPAARTAVPLDRYGLVTVVEVEVERRVNDLAEDQRCTRSTVINELLKFALTNGGVDAVRRIV